MADAQDYTPKQVSEALGVSLRTLQRDEAAGRITAHWLGGVRGHGRKRYSAKEVDRYRRGK